MKVGDLVKVKNLSSSDCGIIINMPDWNLFCVYFLSLEYDMIFGGWELELISEGR